MSKTLYTFLVWMALGCIGQQAAAHEGMWIPSKLAMVIDDMHSQGLKLSAEEIYSINQSSLKDAIVHFGGGCTAEVISREGLILTNHHCGYGQIQTHSSLENDYLRDGFWAFAKSDELPNAGLSATFIVRIDDVTAQLRQAVEGKDGVEREQALRQKVQELIAAATAGTHYTAEVKPFFYGNEFYLIAKETFPDVRLVGAPPSSIGKFGYDADNWVWPRHTGDFALFRIYAGPDNKPAAYSPDNVPYTPRHSLPINMKGLEEGDYTMVFGFPGSTEQYLSSHGVAYVLEQANPARKRMRDASLGVIDAAMLANDTVRIQYAAKQSRIANAHKKWIGQSMGLERFNTLELRRAHEAEFAEKAQGLPEASLPDRIGALYAQYSDYALAREYLIEFYYYGPEILRFARQFTKLADTYSTLESSGELQTEIDKLRKSVANHFKDYNRRVDRDILAAQLPHYLEGCPGILISPTLQDLNRRNANNAQRTAAEFFAKSVFDNPEALLKLLDKPSKKLPKQLQNDVALQVANEILELWENSVLPGYQMFKFGEEELMGAWLPAMMELMPERRYSPDANSTLRITYGRMEGSEPRDGMQYLPYTTLDGVAEKYIPGDRDFDVHPQLLELHAKRDYGRYATNGEMRVCFLGSHHTTGGNSGSPALDAHGHLVGLNFDRTWESTMSDIMFAPDICRNIMVDIKYVLFVVDKFAGAGHLVEEMELVY